MFKVADLSNTEKQDLQRKLDIAKSQVFLRNNAAFFGPLMCTQEFVWTRDIPSAATDGIRVWWNPDWFLSLDPEVRITVLVHELQHTARLHSIRMDKRDPAVWNFACDFRINNDLEREGFSFANSGGLLDPTLDVNGQMPEEDIYELLMQDASKQPNTGSWGGDSDDGMDLVPCNPGDAPTAIGNVVQAVQQAKMGNKPGDIPGGVEEFLNEFMAPKVNWRKELQRFFTDMEESEYSYSKPNKRYEHILLPSLVESDGKLEHIMYFMDVSCSVTTEQIKVFNSEVKFIQDKMQPEKLTIVQFDTQIQKVDVYTEGQAYKEMHITGRGGTCFECVHEYIEKHRPSAAIIFSDMECTPMAPVKIPVIWACVGNYAKTVPVHSGKKIYINL